MNKNVNKEGVAVGKCRVLIRGVNDVGSAVAHRLIEDGHVVVIHDVAQPTTSRRGMAFADAMFDGHAQLEGIQAHRADSLADITARLNAELSVANEAIVTAFDFTETLRVVKPRVLIDARMRKRAVPESQIWLAPITIGLGPNFTAGVTTDVVVETAYGEDLGRVYSTGGTRPLAGEPREIDGRGRERFVYAPVEGTVETDLGIGDLVTDQEVVARIGTNLLRAPITGALRGLTHHGVPVTRGTKVIEVDPRGSKGNLYGVGMRPGQIADGIRMWLRLELVGCC
ncbi:MAG: hypothetical protein U0821_26815 [Chloroflexota bacterium]